MSGPWERYAAPADGPWSKYAVQAAKPSEPHEAIDYGRPSQDVLTDIERLPATSRDKALALWADREVSKEPRPMPNMAEGIPIIGGLLDEGNALVESGMNALTMGKFGNPYDQALALQRARSRAGDAENPALAAVGKLATGVVTGGPLFSRIAPAATLAGRVGQGAAIGGATGFVEGATRGEGGLPQRIEAGGDVLGSGAAIGAAFPIAGALATRGAGAYADYIQPTVTRLRHGPEQAADEILANRIAREGSTPAQKRLELQRGQAQTAVMNQGGNQHGQWVSRATLPETIADTSDEMARLTGSVYRAGGEAGNAVKGRLDARQRGPENPYAPRATDQPQGQYERINDATERALLIRSAASARQSDQQIMRQQAQEGRRLYDEAYNTSENFDISPAVVGMGLRIQQYPAPFASVLNKARDLFVRSGAGMNRPFYVDNIRRFDASKKALDDMIETAQRGGENNLARELTQFKDDLLNQVHGVDASGAPTRNLVYQQARQAWGSAAENREAIELGRAALRDSSEVSAEQYRALTEGQQRLFRIGFLDSMRSTLGKTKPGTDVTQQFQQRRVQELMNEIIPRSRGRNTVFQNRPERFGDLMRREQRMVQTRNTVLGNSATAQRQQDDMAFAGDALRGMWDRFRSSPSLFNMGIEAVGAGIQRVFGYRQDVASALARRLLETEPEARNQILRRLQRRGGPDAFERFARGVDQAAISISGTTMPAAISDMRGKQ